MTMISLDTKITEEENLLASARKAFALAREEIERMAEAVADTNMKEAEEAIPGFRKIHTFLQICTETENRLANVKQQKVGIAQNGFALDLDTARLEIGRKLDRLRAAAGAE
jgi:hypothetical protein